MALQNCLRPVLIFIIAAWSTAAFAQTDNWQRVAGSGFGDRNNRSIGEFHVFRGQLYAGTLRNPMSGAGQLWRTADGVNWTQVTGFSPTIAGPQTIVSMADSGGSNPQFLYAGTITQVGTAVLYRSTDGTTWTQINGAGSGWIATGNTLISPNPVVKDGFIYVGTQNDAGGQIWRRPVNDSAPWTRVVDFAGIDSNLQLVTYFYVFNGTIYAPVADFGGRGGVLYMSTDGVTWTRNSGVGNGFGNRNNITITSIADFRGYLYAATRNLSTGGEMWRSRDGLAWEKVAGNGFGSSLDEENHNIRVAKGRLWVATMDRSPSLFRVFSTTDGTTFTKSNVDGFGDSNNTNTSQGTGTLVVEFGESVYWGGQNTVTGAQVWRFTPSIANSATTFNIVNRAGTSRLTSGTAASVSVGYARIQPDSGSTTPAGLAIFGFRQNGVLVSEAAVPATTLLQSGRIYAEVNGPVNTGLAIANPGSQSAVVGFFFTDINGQNFGNGITTISPGAQIAAFLNEFPFSGGASINGTFTFNSSQPVSVIALRGFTNESSQFLITTLSVTDLSTPGSQGQTIVFPHFADGGGWTTQIVLTNPADEATAGFVQFFDASGQPVPLTIDGKSAVSFAFAIAARSSRVLRTASPPNVNVGSVRVTADPSSRTPSGQVIFSFKQSGVTVTEAGVPVVRPSSAFRIYAEVSGAAGQPGSTQTGLAIANSANSPAMLTFELTSLTGASVGATGSVTIPANGQTAMFLDQIPGLGSLPVPLQGVLRISSLSGSISVVGLRGRYNESGRFLITTTSPSDENALPANSEVFFAHFVDGGGYTTQFILFSGSSNQSSAGTVKFVSQSGQALSVPF